MSAAENPARAFSPEERSPHVSTANEEKSDRLDRDEIENVSSEDIKVNNNNPAKKNWVLRTLRTRKRKWICCGVSSIIIATVAFPLMLVLYRHNYVVK